MLRQNASDSDIDEFNADKNDEMHLPYLLFNSDFALAPTKSHFEEDRKFA